MVVAPHPDDESIGCGGTICLHADAGDRVVGVFLTSGELGLKDRPAQEACRIREREAEAAAEVLGLASLHFLRRRDWYLKDEAELATAQLRTVIAYERPDVIDFPHEDEWHPDHAASRAIVEASLAGAGLPPVTLLAYEVWTPQSEYDDGRDITAVMARKLKAVRCHRSQTQQLPYARAVRGLNEFRGAMAWGCRYAEVFKHQAYRTLKEPPAQ